MKTKWAFRVFGLCLGIVLGLATGRDGNAGARAADLKPGDEVITVDEGIDFGYRERTVAKIGRGVKLLVTEVRDPWIGGQVTVNNEIQKGWLHKHEVRRAAIEIPDLPPATDEKSALAYLEKLGAQTESDDEGHVQVVNATDTGLPDAALDALKHFPKLYDLQLGGTAITDAGLKKLADLKSLEMLYVDRTDVSDEGLTAIGGLENLVVLVLERSRVTGKGLAALEGLKELRTLNLSRCPVSDDELEKLGEMKNLEVVTLTKSGLKGEGLKYLQPLPKLRVLNISENPIEEDELLNLKGAPTLKMLYVRGIKVKDDTVAALKDTLVSCAIYRW